MTALSRGAGQSGAESEISGTIAINATWSEDIYFFDTSGAAMDISNLDWEFQFRSDETDAGAVVTLSTADTTLSIVADSGSVFSILRITADPGTFTAYVGDMVADLVATDASDNVTLYGHGIVNFTNNPAV